MNTELPPGYERVESVFKPVGAYWATDIPVRTGMLMSTDFTVEEYTPGSTNQPICDLMSDFIGSRLYYLWLVDETCWFSRRDSLLAGPHIQLGTKHHVEVAHYSTETFFSLDGVRYFERKGLTPYVGTSPFYYLGAMRSTDIIYKRGALRLYRFSMYEEGTGNLMFNFVPFRKLAGGEYVYGLYDVVNRKELPVVEGVIEA